MLAHHVELASALGADPESDTAVAAGQIYAWNPEPIYSYVGAALILEGIAAAIASAESVSG